MFTDYEFCQEDETQAWTLHTAERRRLAARVDDPSLAETPHAPPLGRSDPPLETALTLIADQLPKEENPWLEERVLRLAREIERQRALRAQHRLS